MTRILLMSGKGGVGKTTVAAATALEASRRGYRTLALSIDLAHSLSDAFAVGVSLFDQHRGQPFPVAPLLDVQELDVQEEIERHWSEIFRYIANVLTAAGLDDVVAEEVAILPGTEEVMALTYLNKYVNEHTYDVIVLDAPPTAESLRFVSIYTTLEWYMRRRFKHDRRLVKVAGPLLQRLSELPLPDEGYFDGVHRLFSGLEQVDELLADPAVTTVRLVTNPELMVLRETQRAYSYFSLAGMTTDQVIVNRVMPTAGEVGDPGEGYFGAWAERQAEYVAQIREYFAPLPVATLPFFRQEVLGLSRLHEVAAALYAECDPTTTLIEAPPYEFCKQPEGYLLRLPLPFVDRSAVEVSRVGENLVVRIGSFKRHVPLPRAVQRLRAAEAQVDGAYLLVRFTEPDLDHATHGATVSQR